MKKHILKLFVVIAFTLAVPFTSFSNTKKEAYRIFKKAQTLGSQQKNKLALVFYLKAFKLNPNSGFYAARVAQHYFSRFKQYSKALKYYIKAYQLNFRSKWMKSQMIRTLNWLSDFALAQNKLKNALKYLDSMRSILNKSPEFSGKFLYLRQKASLLTRLSMIKDKSPKYIHKAVVVLIQKVAYSKNGINIHTEMTAQEKKYTILAAKTLKHYIKALSSGKLSINITIKEWKKPVQSLKVSNAKKFVLNSSKIGGEVQSLIAKDIPNTDTFIYIWPSGTKQNAHGGAGKIVFDKNRKKAWRGHIQIPSFRMPYNGPHLLLHEFFHTVENMTYIKPRHGFRQEFRSHFPEWRGRGELDYYLWQFQNTIAKIIRSKKFKQAGWQNMNFIKRYPVRKN